MKALFFGLDGFGIAAALATVDLSLGGECIPLATTSQEVACPTPGEEAGAILIAILTGFASMMLIGVAIVRLLASLLDRISPLSESDFGSDGFSELAQPCSGKSTARSHRRAGAHTSMDITELRGWPPITPQTGATT